METWAGTGNPQITFFKVVYRRHTNFSIESIEQTFNGAADFDRRVTCVVSRNGDLIGRTYLRVTLPSLTLAAPAAANTTYGLRWVDWVGHALIKSVEIEIGGQRIDKHYGEWLNIWNELTQAPGRALGYANMVGNTPDLTGLKTIDNGVGTPITIQGKTLYIPFEFWFCRNPGLALPLIALQYHEVRFTIDFRAAEECYWVGSKTTGGTNWTTNYALLAKPALQGASLFIDYIYLDTDERRRFAQVSHEYLIEQLQYTGDESTSQQVNRLRLQFNHPVKELIFVVQKDEVVSDSASPSRCGKQLFNYTDAFDSSAVGLSATPVLAGAAGGFSELVQSVVNGGENPVDKARLQLNGHDRFSERDGRYFNLVQPYQHHENVPARGINVYSFGLRPEEHQPSGQHIKGLSEGMQSPLLVPVFA